MIDLHLPNHGPQQRSLCFDASITCVSETMIPSSSSDRQVTDVTKVFKADKADLVTPYALVLEEAIKLLHALELGTGSAAQLFDEVLQVLASEFV